MKADFLIDELKSAGITHPAVLNAIASVPREKFVLSHLKPRAYDNVALPIDADQTISQPFIVALMTQTLFNHPNPEKILEIGTGSGYQSAILATIFKEIWTIERIKTLHEKAKEKLNSLGFNNVHCVLGDGSKGLPKFAPFDCIIVTAASNTIPHDLLDQLSVDGGIMVIPVGPPQVQKLTLIKRINQHYEKSILERVSFVPLISN